MSDPIEDRVRQIEALVGEAAAVAHRHKMRSVSASHLLYVIAGTEEGRRVIEEMGGNPRRIRTFLEQAFNHSAEPGLSTGGTEIGKTIHRVTTSTIRRARENARPPQLRDILQEMTYLGEKCAITRQALIVGGVIETLPRRLDDDYMLEEEREAFADFRIEDEEEELTPFDEIPDDVDEDSNAPGETEEPEAVEAAGPAPAQGGEADEHFRAVVQATRDLTQMARNGELDDVIGRDAEIERIIETITKKKKPNLIIAGEPGVGKTALAEGLAIHLASGKAPEGLSRRPMLEVALSDLVAGARFRGDFEARMQALASLARKRNAILFLDEVHLIVGAGAASGRGGMDAANILKPALARGDITVIGATTPGEMREIRRDGALMRRFDLMTVEEPDTGQVRRILDEAVGSYVLHHQVLVEDDMLDLVVDLADRYLPAGRFPDKAFNLVDTACVLARKRGAGRVCADDVRRAIERNGGIRLTSPDESIRERVSRLEETISRRVFGQPEAVEALGRAARAALLGMNQGGTAGAYLFNGPSGVGKTEMAYAFAEAMGYPLVRIDMSEFMEKHAVSGLIGAPPGYVGYDRDGILVEAADKHGDMVLLFDEAEKAHPEVYDILLQILDNGSLRSADGRMVSFARAHVILSANIGAAEAEKPALGFGRETNAAEATKDALGKTFRKEMLARIRNRIQFGMPAEEARAGIVRKELDLAQRRYADSGYKVTFDETLVSWILSRPDSDGFAGRGLQDRILEEILDPVVTAFLEDPERRVAHVTLEGDRIILR